MEIKRALKKLSGLGTDVANLTKAVFDSTLADVQQWRTRHERIHQKENSDFKKLEKRVHKLERERYLKKFGK